MCKIIVCLCVAFVVAVVESIACARKERGMEEREEREGGKKQ